jgi:hypothetical protein
VIRPPSELQVDPSHAVLPDASVGHLGDMLGELCNQPVPLV